MSGFVLSFFLLFCTIRKWILAIDHGKWVDCLWHSVWKQFYKGGKTSLKSMKQSDLIVVLR